MLSVEDYGVIIHLNICRADSKVKWLLLSMLICASPLCTAVNQGPILKIHRER